VVRLRLRRTTPQTSTRCDEEEGLFRAVAAAICGSGGASLRFPDVVAAPNRETPPIR